MTTELIVRRRKLIWGSLVFLSVLLALYYQYSLNRVRRENLQALDIRLAQEVGALPLLLAPDFHDRAKSADAISLQEELLNRERINAFVRVTGLRYAQTIVEQDGRFYFSAPTITEEEAKEQERWYFYPYDDIPPEFRRVYEDGGEIYLTYHDQWGSYRSFCKRFLSPEGQPYLALADLSLDSVEALLSRARIFPILTILYILLALLPLCVASFLVFNDLKKLNAELERHNESLENQLDDHQVRIADAERELRKGQDTLELMQVLNRNSLSGLIVFDKAGAPLDINPSAMKFLGFRDGDDKEEQYRRSSLSNLLKQLGTQIRASGIRGQELFTTEYAWHRQDGTPLTLYVRAGYMQKSGGDRPLLYYASFHDITNLKEQEERLNYVVHHDPFSGLLNRDGLLEQVRKNTPARSASPGVLVFTLKDFKRINEALGTRIGDAILLELIRRLQSVTKKGEELARLGGVGFALASHELVDQASGEEIAARALSVLDKPFEANGKEFSLSGCVGVRPRSFGKSFEELLGGATIAMIEAKQSGRNRVVFFSEKLQTRSIQSIEMESAMRDSIRSEGFNVVFQPIVSIIQKRICGMEALARWSLPDGRPVSPDTFITMAEQSGLMQSLSEILFSLSAKHFLTLYSKRPDLYLSLNVSAVLFRDGVVEGLLIERLENKGVKPESVMLEITETALIDDMENCRDILVRLVKRGYSIAIDDFGAGNSSMTYLQNFPIRKLKIDKSFIQNIVAREKDWQLVQAILRMSEVLKIDVVAEGVETELQERELVALGCPFAQGYFYHRPASLEHCFQLLERNP